jgi:hypothetical protein
MGTIIAFITLHWVWFAFAILYIINVIIGKHSQLDSWVLAHPKVGGTLKLIRGFLPCEPFLILQGISLLIKGTLPAKLTPIVDVITKPAEELKP